MNQSRLDTLAEMITKSDLAGVALNAGPSLTYFTGLNFHLMERPVVFVFLPKSTPLLILPRLEAAKVSAVDGTDLFFYEENPDEWPGVFAKALYSIDISGKKLGVEPLGLRFIEYTLLQNGSTNVQFTDCTKLISSLRGRKDEQEIAIMQKAVDIAESALRATLPQVKRGMEEREIAAELVMQLFRHGSEPKLPFSPIVSGGPNGANPHAKPSTRKIGAGDLLVIDWGAAIDGYVSDLTRTFAVGEIDKESAKIHELVQEANAAGRSAGVVGAACGDVDRAARQVIEEAGYGKFFTHRTGHGIGKECHEEPYIRSDNKEILVAGMTYTVEPGIYLPGKNGVRIEDDVLVTAEGPVSLSSLPRKIIQIG